MEMRRRQFLGGILASALTTPGIGSSDGAYSGRVTGDGCPLAGVVVTDGLYCTLTDSEGRFVLAKRPSARFLSVTVPTGWRARKAHYVRVTSASHDFELTSWRPSVTKGCTFMQIADSETPDMEWVPNLKGAADRDDVAFVVHTGDICYKDGMKAHAKGLTSETLGRPMYYCIGNHDLVDGAYGEELFESLFGPCWYSFDAGGVHFIVIPMKEGDYGPSYTHNAVADWMRNDLAYVPKDRPVVLFSHMLTHNESASDMGRKIGSGPGEFDIAANCNLSAFVYGHVHHSFFRRRGKVALVSSSAPCMGGIGHDPALYRTVHVSEDGRTTARSRYVPKSEWTDGRGGAVWETDLGGPVQHGAPIAVGDRVFVATIDDDGLGTAAVIALDAMSGRILWKSPMETSVKGAIVCLGGKVFAQDVDGHVRAFAAEDGRSVWHYDLPPDPVPHWPLFAGVTADAKAGVIYAGHGLRLCALKAATGDVLWTGPGGWKISGEPVCTVPGIGSGVIVSCSQWSGLHANDAATGRSLWFSDKHGEIFCGAVPLVGEGVVRALVDRRFNEYDLGTGRLLRSRELDTKVENPTAILKIDGKFIFGTWKGVYALDVKTLDLHWKAVPGEALVVNAAYCKRGPAVSSAPVAVNEKSGVFSAQDGTIRFFSFADGRMTRTVETGAPYFATPAVHAGHVFAADFAGRIRAFRI